MVAMDSDDIEEIIMHEYVYPFICIEENGEMIMLRENTWFRKMKRRPAMKTRKIIISMIF